MNTPKTTQIALLFLSTFITTLLTARPTPHKLTPAQEYDLLVIDNYKLPGSDLEKYLHTRNLSYLVATKKTPFSKIMRHRFKGVILTGGPLCYSSKKLDVEDINVNFAAILNLDCPILGICFGHQTIAELFGGKMSRLQEFSEGKQEVQLLQEIDLFDGLKPDTEFSQSHYDCVIEIPYNFDLIATSQVCYAEAIKHKTKPIYGVQFHPEFSGKQGYKLLDNFLKICKIQAA